MKFALIAHDGKKADMVGFVMKRLSFFKRDDVELVGTGTTGGMIENAGHIQRQKCSNHTDLIAVGSLGRVCC